MDIEHAGELVINYPVGNRAIDGHAAAIEEPIYETAIAIKNTAHDIGKPDVDTWPNCHSCYFHVRMYGEGDYFMISDLKRKAKEKFLASLINCSEKKCFSETITELYSTHAKYELLRKLAIEVIVNNLSSFRKGFAPVIDSKLMESVPDFAIDLCLPAIDKYVSEPPSMKPNPFLTGFEYNGVDYRLYPNQTALVWRKQLEN